MGNLIIFAAILWLMTRENAEAQTSSPIQSSYPIPSQSPIATFPQPTPIAINQSAGAPVFDWSSIPGAPEWLPDEEPPFLVTAPFECLSYMGLISPYPECNPSWQNLPENPFAI